MNANGATLDALSAPPAGLEPPGSLWRKLGLLGGMIVGLSVAHYLTDLHVAVVHDVMDRFYYVPIALAAFWFGWKGAAAAGLLATLLFLPHIMQFESAHFDHPMHVGNKYVEAVMFPLFGIFVGYLVDIIRKRNSALEASYRTLASSFDSAQRSARLAAIGQMAAGLAHEIRNPLAGLHGSLEAISDQMPADNALAREFVGRSLAEVQRVNRLVADFVALGRPAPLEKAPADLSRILDETLALVRPHAQKSGVEIICGNLPECPEMLLDADRIKQAALNLMLNAIQAMPEGGRIEVGLACDGGEVVLKVADSGPGIAPEDADRIFTPFFTTKKQGAGLGLALARQAVELHGGRLELMPSAGAGATFQMTLPVEAQEVNP